MANIKSFYGFLESIEINDQYIDLDFDAFSSSLFASFLSNEENMPQYDDALQVKIKVPKNLQRNFELDRWYFLTLGQNNFEASLKRIFTSESIEERLKIESIRKIDGRTREGRSLYRYFSLEGFQEGTIVQIESLLSQKAKDDRYVAVYDVGQGNCNALCEHKNGVIFYYDFGADIRTVVGTFPINQRYCLTHKPFVVLSHWDKDHWFGSHYFQAIKKMNWIVPKQHLGFSHLVLANELYANGTLIIWPNQLARVQFPSGEVVRCTGRSRNDSGLAVIINLTSNSQSKNVLLPGDSSYRYIPNIPNQLHGLVASHHGGNVTGFLPTPAINQSAIVFSVSVNPHHGHPLPRMVTNYMNLGWRDIRTSGSHVGLSLTNPTNNGCAGTICDLQITRWY